MSHAYLYIAESIDQAALPEPVRAQSVDVEHFIMDRFGIDDARRLKERAHLRSVSGAERLFLVSCGSMTSEAQNALLKLFEEPPADVVFHVVVKREDMLVPTLRSRLLLCERATKGESIPTGFFSMGYKERIAEIASRAKQRDASWFESVAREAEYKAYNAPQDERRRLLASVVLVRSYLGSRGASSKMLTEELALSYPPQN